MESTIHWLSEDAIKFEVEVRVCEELAKNVAVDTRKIHVSQRNDVRPMQRHGNDSVVVGCALVLRAFWAIGLVSGQM